jgi:hypothetical protein
MTDADWKMAKDGLVHHVKVYASEHYGSDEGWDIVIETMSDKDILDIVWRARTEAGAVRKMAAYIAPAAAYRSEIIAEAF